MDSEPQARPAQRVAIWDRAAVTYGLVGPPFFAYFGRRLVSRTPLSPGAQVLDVATGRGAVLFPAAERVGPTGRVVGVDYAPAMVAATTAEIRAQGIGNAQVQRMDAAQLEFAPATFDVVLCASALFFFPDLHTALAEFRRVLQPGGTLAVSTWATRDPRWAWLEAMRPRTAAPAAGALFNTPAGMAGLLRDAGFRDVRTEVERKEFYYADDAAWWATLWSHGPRLELEPLPQAALDAIQARAAEHFPALRGPHGIPEQFTAIFTFGTKPPG